MTASTAERILDIAEERIRGGGFDAVSFRDIAAALGIRSASVHYHFPQKTDLGRAVVARYRERFLTSLGPADGGPGIEARLARLVRAYRDAYEDARTTCLCAVLGAATGALPPAVQEEVRRFFEELLAWTETALHNGQGKPVLSPALVIATLQGAMILAIATERPTAFEEAAAALEHQARRHR